MEVMKTSLKHKSVEPISVYGEPIEEVDLFIYLCSAVDKTGGTDADIKARKARSAFKKMKNVWSSATLSSRLKVRVFNATIKPVLLYGSETWRMNNTPINKVQSFVNTCLRKIPAYTGQKLSQILSCGKEPTKYLSGMTLHRESGGTEDCITRQALTWNPQGSRKRGRPRNTWRRYLDKERARMGVTWGELCRTAEDRDGFKALIGGLCSQGTSMATV